MRFLFLLIATAILAPLPGYAQEVGFVECAKIRALDNQAKAGEFCRNYNSLLNKSSSVREPAKNCLKYAAFVVQTLKEICDYEVQAERVARDDNTLVTELLPNAGQRTDLSDQLKMVAAKHQFGDKYWRQFFETMRQHEKLYYAYQKSSLALGKEVGSNAMRQEVMSCGVPGELFSFTLFGLSKNAVEEGDKVYHQLRNNLRDILYDNVQLKRAVQGQIIKLRAATRNIGEQIPEASQAIRHEGEAPEENRESYAINTTQGGAVSYASERATHAAIGHFSVPGLPHATAGAAGIAGTIVDVGLHWAVHHELDEIKLTFTGLRLVVAAGAAAGAIPSGSGSEWLGLGIEAGITVLETWANKIRDGVYIPNAQRYLSYWANTNLIDNNGDRGQGGALRLKANPALAESSQAAAKEFHNRTAFENHDNPYDAGRPANSNPAFSGSNFQCK